MPMSSVAQVMDRLRAVGDLVPRLERPYQLAAPRFGPGCCEAEIDELLGEDRTELAEYAEFLSRCRRVDAADVHDGYFLYSPLLVVQQSDAPRQLHVGEEPNFREVEVLCVGGDGGGNQFVMSSNGPLVGTVWKWNHEQVVRLDRVAREGLTKIADSFVGFLERVALDWEKFVAGDDPSWPYISG